MIWTDKKYIYYLINKQKLLFVSQDKHEEISNHEMTKRLAQKWNGLTPEQKKVFKSKIKFRMVMGNASRDNNPTKEWKTAKGHQWAFNTVTKL